MDIKKLFSEILRLIVQWKYRSFGGIHCLCNKWDLFPCWWKQQFPFNRRYSSSTLRIVTSKNTTMFNINNYIEFIIIWRSICVYVNTVDDKRLLHFFDAFTMYSLATFVIATNILARLQNCVTRQLASSCFFVRLSVLTEQPDCHWTDLLEIWYFEYFPQICR